MVDEIRTNTHLIWREMEQPPSAAPQATVASKRVSAGVCGILLGALGVHKFILGYTKEGIIMLLASVLAVAFGGLMMALGGLVVLVGLIEGIIYLTKSDQEFVKVYMTGRRGWF